MFSLPLISIYSAFTLDRSLSRVTVVKTVVKDVDVEKHYIWLKLFFFQRTYMYSKKQARKFHDAI